MPGPGSSARCSASQASRAAWLGSCDDAEMQRLAVEVAAQHQHVVEHRRAGDRELLGDVGGDPGVGRGGGREHRDALRQVGQHGADPPVVRPEVVAPVRDAVRLVDHQQPGGRGQPGQHLVAELRVVEPLRADQQDVDLAPVDGVVGRRPVAAVGGVDGHGVDAGPLRGGDLVAHQREQRRDDDRWPGAGAAQQGRGHEVDRRLAPAGALHDQGPAPVGHQGLDRGPLVVPQRGVVAADQRPEMGLGLGPQLISRPGQLVRRRTQLVRRSSRSPAPACPVVRTSPPVVHTPCPHPGRRTPVLTVIRPRNLAGSPSQREHRARTGVRPGRQARGTISGAPSRALSAVSSSGCSWESRSASTRAR